MNNFSHSKVIFANIQKINYKIAVISMSVFLFSPASAVATPRPFDRLCPILFGAPNKIGHRRSNGRGVATAEAGEKRKTDIEITAIL
jgi:hypothetical protein